MNRGKIRAFYVTRSEGRNLLEVTSRLISKLYKLYMRVLWLLAWNARSTRSDITSNLKVGHHLNLKVELNRVYVFEWKQISLLNQNKLLGSIWGSRRESWPSMIKLKNLHTALSVGIIFHRWIILYSVSQNKGSPNWWFFSEQTVKVIQN